MVDALECISDRVSVPIIIDADTGFGGPMNVQRTVRGFERAGASMIQIEDQAFPKRCGHLLGKVIVPVVEMCGKLRAAVDARTDASTLIMARTDSVTVEGLDAALERAERYLECGVDALFVETLQSREHLEIAGRRFGKRVPLLANMVEGGRAPLLGSRELAELGYRIVIFPGGTSRYVVRALQTYFATLHRDGTTESMLPSMLGFHELNEVIGTPDLLRAAESYE
jgi:2-methylisocitrate lyase-like PEP mutase family enzyme